MKALKVKIERDSSGGAKYPQFGLLPSVQSSGMDWSTYVDRQGHGWQYDSVGHDDEETDSPRGQQWGLLVIPDAFADEAASQFPDQCSVITEVEAETFFDQRVARKRPDTIGKAEQLTALAAELDLLEKLSQQGSGADRQKAGARLTVVRDRARKALDPDDDEPGVRNNDEKTWQRFKAKRNFRIG